MTVRNVCKISGPECPAPAGWGIPGGYYINTDETVGRTKCYVCEEPVCKVDSRFVTWYGRRVRACTDCVPLVEGEIL